MSDKNKDIENIVKAYFEHPDKTLKEIFGEYTIGFSKERKKAFYNNLKAIIN